MDTITVLQEKVIAAVVDGSTLTAAAEAAGVHRNTISNWRRNSKIFRDTLCRAQHEKAVYFRENAESLMQSAMENFRALLADAKTPATVRFKTAQFIFMTATTSPPLEPVLPGFAPRNFTIVPDDENLENLHKNAQSPVQKIVESIRRELPKTGRNQACPCGSGKKFKRCCLGRPSPPIPVLEIAAGGRSGVL